jgi:hypothetical protein
MGHIVQQPVSIIAELEEAVRSGSSAKRVSTLRQVTDLFLHDGERLSEDQVRVFDDVLCHLVARVETRVKAELGARLSPLEYAPSGVIEQLAWDDEIAVAGTVLANSSRLTTSTLVEIAKTKGQDHLLAISGRTTSRRPSPTSSLTGVNARSFESLPTTQARGFPIPATMAWSRTLKPMMNLPKYLAFGSTSRSNFFGICCSMPPRRCVPGWP